MPPAATQKSMSNGAATTAVIWPPNAPMEPIPEEETDQNESPRHHAVSTNPRTTESVHRKREVYTSEQIDTLVSTLPKDTVPEEWRNLPSDEVVSDPIMAHTYVTHLPGQTSARSSRTTYVYESHDDEAKNPLENTASYSDYADNSLERHSHSTQKVTRVTKITTTRSIRQVPVDPSDIFFDADGNPISSAVDDYDPDSLGIDLSHSMITEAEELRGIQPLLAKEESVVPSAPHRPDVSVTEDGDILLSWNPPLKSGTGGEILGYLVEFRRNDEEPWESAHDELLVDNECRVSKLEDLEYRFRVSAANRVGFGDPSASTQPILRQKGTSPQRARVLRSDADRVLIEWEAPVDSASLIGYLIEYRLAGSTSWLPANDFPVTATRFEVINLRPNAEYEFRVIAKYESGVNSEPSASTGYIRIHPVDRSSRTPQRSLPPSTPGQPRVIAADRNWVRLRWDPSDPVDRISPQYLVEVREAGDPNWFVVGPHPIGSNEFIADNLHPNAGYEFRITAMGADGVHSQPSAPSEVVRLSAITEETEAAIVPANSGPPERPAPPEYLDFDGGNSVVLCWIPAKSVLPVLGYEVEFRDLMQDPTSWYKVTDHLVRSCKTTVGYLINAHQYQFRIIAKNANGLSEPSDPSPLITIGSLTKETKYLEAERHAAVSLLQDEMIRESPPLPDRDDSPPPMNRQPDPSNLQWRDPTLKEVIEYLKSGDENTVLDASGYLQHLTYNNDIVKEDTRQYGGIPVLVRLLQHRNSEVVRNVCGSLKNLSFGCPNDDNKVAIHADGGVKGLANVLRTTPNVHVREEATGALWNISSCDQLKEPVFHEAADVVVQYVVVPSSGLLRAQPADQGKHGTATVFRNGTGVLRNVSAASPQTRKLLRVVPGLIEALLFALRSAVNRKQVDSRAVENVVCILRNLSYRVQEVVDPKYDPRATSRSARERSKSAPSFSPRNRKKPGIFKKSKKEEMEANGTKVTGPALLWHPETVELYIRVLQESADPEILEASAAALQNLAACQFDGSVQVRESVRTLKGLPVLVELLKLRDDKVVCAIVTALRNLCIDPKNLDLVGRHAMRDLLGKLPAAGQEVRDPEVSDGTVGAVLGILWEIVRSNPDLTRFLHENGGTDRLRTLAKSYPAYGKRVCKYATQVLYFMWQNKELQEIFRKAGLRDADFYCGTIARRGRSAAPSVDMATLRRPISSQGNERPAHLRSETADDTIDSIRYGNFESASPSTGRASTARYADYSPVTYNGERSASVHPQRSPRTPRTEPVYAAVHKRSSQQHRNSIGGDSWV